MITEFDYQKRFIDNIEPLLNDILQRLDRFNIPYFFIAAVKNSKKETVYERRMRTPKDCRKSLRDDIFPYLQMVINGASVLQLGPKETNVSSVITSFNIANDISTKEKNKLDKDIQIMHLKLYENQICHVLIIAANNTDESTGYYESPNLLPIVKKIKLKDDLLKRCVMVQRGFWYTVRNNEEDYFTEDEIEENYEEDEDEIN